MAEVHPLKSHRDQRNPPLSQKELADMIGTSVATLSRWETGQRNPDLEKLPVITKVTGIPASILRPDIAVLFVTHRKRASKVKRRRAA